LNGPGTWASALGGTFTGTACAGPAHNVPVPGVGTFRLTCAASNTNADLENYQVSVIATAYMPQGRNSENLVPTRAMQAYLSRRTLGVTLPNGVQASAALQLVRPPTAAAGSQTTLATNALNVHWGPISCYQLYLLPTPDAAWTLPNPIDQVGGSEGYPRVFSNGGLKGQPTSPYPRLEFQETSAQATDNTQWWAFASLQVPPQIDTATYVNLAKAQVGAAQVGGGIRPNPPGCALQTGNYYALSTSPCAVELHDDGSTPLTNLSAGTIVVVDGPTVDITAEFTGTLIVSNNVTIGGTSGGVPVRGSAKPTLNIPTAAYKEYMAISAANPTYPWPCGVGAQPAAVRTCSSGTANVGNINFTGFLYAESNLTVNMPWVVNGAIAVGDMSQNIPTGQLIIPAAGSLTLLYDASIGRNIRVLSNELQIDQIQEASPQ